LKQRIRWETHKVKVVTFLQDYPPRK
jgi:hypothetical protein